MNSILRKIKQWWTSFRSNKKKKVLHKPSSVEEKHFFKLTAPKKIPSLKQLRYLSHLLSSREKKLVKTLSIIILLSMGFLGFNVYRNYTEIVPADTGEYVEGMLGAPLYINPILSQTNDIDADISRLVFSGLLRFDKNHQLVNDLATNYSKSEDGLQYTVTIRQDAFWHDGESVTANDIISTFNYILDPAYRSPLLISFNGTTIEKIDDYTIRFTLPKPYTPFPSLLTFGVLPAHIWDGVKPENALLVETNIKPIGSGSWKFVSLGKDSKTGAIRSYTLARNEDTHLEKPHLEKITFKFFDSIEDMISAYTKKEIMGIHFIPQKVQEDLAIVQDLVTHSLSFPQYTAIFFNQDNNEFLADNEVRQALAQAINRTKIIEYALNQAGVIVNGPIPQGFIGYNPDVSGYEYNLDIANELLDDLNWERTDRETYFADLKEEITAQLQDEQDALADVLALTNPENADEDTTTEDESDETTASDEADTTEDEDTETETPESFAIDRVLSESEFEEEVLNRMQIASDIVANQEFFRKKDDSYLQVNLTTVDQPENTKAAELIQNFWNKIGITTKTSIVPPQKIAKDTIKKRQYEALLYGENIGSDPDPFPFWHSSQIEDPGLNLSGYDNQEADNLIIEARQTNDEEKRDELYKEFQELLHEDIPAVFLYSPAYTYVHSNKIKGFNLSSIIVPSDRFTNVHEWYTKTKRVFKK